MEQEDSPELVNSPVVEERPAWLKMIFERCYNYIFFGFQRIACRYLNAKNDSGDILHGIALFQLKEPHLTDEIVKDDELELPLAVIYFKSPESVDVLIKWLVALRNSIK